MRSLHSRFILTSVVVVSICLAAAFFALVQIFAESYSTRIQNELTGHINRLAAVLRFSADGKVQLPENPPDNRFLLPYGGLYWQIDDPVGKVELRSASLFDYALPLPQEAHPVGVMHQYRLAGPDGKDVLVQERVLLLAAPEGKRPLRIAAAVNADEVDNARAAFALDIMPYLGMLAVLLVLMSIIQLWIGLRPLNRIGRDLEAVRDRRVGRLAGAYPREVQPLVDRLNTLLETQAAAMENARGRASDLAHGLKTPLTVLANNALTLREKGEGEIADELDHLADTMLSHVEHELARARLTPSADQRSGDADVAMIVDETIRMLQHTEAGERLSWVAGLEEGLTAPIDPHDFRELVGNLLENASKWAKSRVAVTAVRREGFIRLVVEDDGPGVSPERLPDLLRRGVRLDRLKPGSGLGLAIVSEIANVYNLALTLENRVEGGLRAEVACSDPLPSPET
ncbi:HAMP domain-containing sensor histidine kinase (plasmid) [Ensifer adhaerens]|uniref:sensor histidine kinase n=1 Tax=Ensifer adhaerens TaxID=106592 RepID=UPI0023A96654|nr:HAMP domain-containing sensor histidine kinase [Ensifer adhaerens]WDZ81569.1 HAMP domain-containing sensor histidine kinase [Ensifer adhaerens]